MWKTTKQSKGFDDVWFYHFDHLGTPQEMTDHTGSVIWKAEYKAWGECKAEKTKSNFFENSEIISNNIHFKGSISTKKQDSIITVIVITRLMWDGL